MYFPSKRDLVAATRLTRAGRLNEATRILQRVLAGTPIGIPIPDAGQAVPRGTLPGASGIGEALRGLLGKSGAPPMRVRTPFHPAPDEAAPAGEFVERRFSNAAGSRPYKLYLPARDRGRAPPLLVMLHGCTQSPDDFAAGTRMNALAEAHGWLVAYPAQITSANNAKCWNWFNAGDQLRDGGEPSLIAGITREVMDAYGADPSRVYVAGMSAGGAAAAILGDAYPDLYAAIGVHSGLACGAASDPASAFAAMRNGAGKIGQRAVSVTGRLVPTIVFHGTHDSTVHPANADAIVSQVARATKLSVSVEPGQVPDGHAYQRILHTDAAGKTMLEQWKVEGGGHAWSGGSAAGTYTDPLGPDASREMLRFFQQHRHPGLA